MADDFVQGFSALSTKEERTSALLKLVQTLDFEERWVLSAAVSEKNDLIPSLPLELRLQVFSYLPLLDAWSLQSVNRQWSRVLSSKEFLRATLSRWDTHDPSDSGRCKEAVATDSIRNRIRHMLAIQLGRPFSVTRIDDAGTGLQGPRPQLSHRRLELKGNLIAYVSSKPEDGDSVIVRDLITGTEITLRGEARERILSIILTATLVAFVTFDGSLYVTEIPVSGHLSLGLTSRVQLTSSRIRASGGDRTSIVLAMGGDENSGAHVTELLFYDTRDKRLRSLPLPKATHQWPEGHVRELISSNVLLDSRNGTADVFTLIRYTDHVKHDKSLQIWQQRISLCGEVISESTWKHSLHYMNYVQDTHFTMAPPQPTGYRGLFRLQVGEPPKDAVSVRSTFEVLFNVTTGAFAPHNSDKCYCVLDGSEHRKVDLSPLQNNWHSEWKDMGIVVEHPYNRISWLEHIALMNDTFLVSLEVSYKQTQCSRIRVFCFDRSVRMHRARKTYLWKDVPKLGSVCIRKKIGNEVNET